MATAVGVDPAGMIDGGSVAAVTVPGITGPTEPSTMSTPG